MKVYLLIFITVLSFGTMGFAQIEFIPHILTPSENATTNNATYVLTFDVENDGDMDIVSSSYVDNKIAWYENDGNQEFTQHIISTSARGASWLYAADMDRDQDVDILSSAMLDNKVYWYENDGHGGFITHIVDSSANPVIQGKFSVYAYDVDGDNDMDVLSGSWDETEVEWHENDGNQNFTTHLIDNPGGRSHVIAKDLDDDGDADILSASRRPNMVAWYENDGDENFTTHIISDSASGARTVVATDFDGDGDIDVLTARFLDDGGVEWYENDGNQNFTTHYISSSPTNSGSIYVVDVDNDDDLDILTATGRRNMVGWLENDGDENFIFHIITTGADFADTDWGADVDGDGDIDILSAALEGDQIAWYESYFIDSRRAHADSLHIDNTFRRPGLDTLSISCRVLNLFKSSLQVQAHILSHDNVVDHYQTLSETMNGIWSSQWPVPEGERYYTVSIRTTDMDSSTVTHNLPRLNKHFTTIGPITFEDYTMLSKESITFPNPGYKIQYNFSLKNMGSTATAPNVTAKVISTDSCASFSQWQPIYFSNLNYGDIAPGESIEGQQDIYYFDNCSDPVHFALEIYIDGYHFWSNTFSVVTAIEKSEYKIPKVFALHQNYPNPFNPRTVISWQVGATRESSIQVDLAIYNILGQKLITMVSEKQEAGFHTVEWDASHMASGVYYYRLVAGDFQEVKKMILLR